MADYNRAHALEYIRAACQPGSVDFSEAKYTTLPTLHVPVSESDLAFLLVWAQDGVDNDTLDRDSSQKTLREVRKRIYEARVRGEAIEAKAK